MGNAARRDELLAEIRSLSFEDREYIETALMQDSYTESPEELEEIMRRARAALSSNEPGLTREELIANARAAAAAVHSRKP